MVDATPIAFTLHPTLSRDCIYIDTLSACQLLLLNDSRYPWLILVPERIGLRDLDDLTPDDDPRVWADIRQASHLLRHLYHPDKLNVAALGNMVPQLHIHLIARFTTDAAWPQPVWGHPPLAYAADALQTRLDEIKHTLRAHKKNQAAPNRTA